MTTYTKQQIEQIITDVATQHGVDPKLAIATAIQESGLNPNDVGDNGTSFGLFQLHKGGELGNLTKEQAFDPTTNANVALSHFAAIAKNHQGMDPGLFAWTAQGAAQYVKADYVRNVDATIASLTKTGGVPVPTSGGASGGSSGGSVGSPGLLDQAANAVTGGASGLVTQTEGIITLVTSPSFWIRVAFILGGFLVVLIGLRAMVAGGGLTAPVGVGSMTTMPAPANTPATPRKSITRRVTHAAEEGAVAA